jgi:hypothetical protein
MAAMILQKPSHSIKERTSVPLICKSMILTPEGALIHRAGKLNCFPCVPNECICSDSTIMAATAMIVRVKDLPN